MPAAFTEGRYIMCIVLLIVMQCIFHDIKSSHMSFHASKKKKKKINNFILIVQSPSPVKSLHTSSIKACLIKNVNAYTIICNFVNGGGPFCHSLILVYNGYNFPPLNKIN